MSNINYYKVLNLPKTCTISDIKLSYRKLILLWHPDKHKNIDPDEKNKINNKFIEINTAYDILSDDNKKKLYDEGKTLNEINTADEIQEAKERCRIAKEDRIRRFNKKQKEAKHLEKERLDKIEKERLENKEKERIEKERLDKIEKDRLVNYPSFSEKIKRFQERIEYKQSKERVEKERVEIERAEKERIEIERIEIERLEKEWNEYKKKILNKSFGENVLQNLHKHAIDKIISDNSSQVTISSYTENKFLIGSHIFGRWLSELRKLESTKQHLYTSIVFHGTPEANCDSILCNSLDSNKRIRQVMGPGEYFGKNIETSLSYCQNDKKMLIFAVINKQDGITTENQNLIVIHNTSYQLPIGFITLCDHLSTLRYNWFWNNKLLSFVVKKLNRDNPPIQDIVDSKIRIEIQQEKDQEKERLEQIRLEKIRLEKEKLEKIRLDKIRLEKEQLEKIRLEKERLEKIRLENERLEKERLEKIQLEKIRLEKEKIEKERLEKIRLEKKQQEIEERERLVRIKREKEIEDELIEKNKRINKHSYYLNNSIHIITSVFKNINIKKIINEFYDNILKVNNEDLHNFYKKLKLTYTSIVKLSDENIKILTDILLIININFEEINILSSNFDDLKIIFKEFLKLIEHINIDVI